MKKKIKVINWEQEFSKLDKPYRRRFAAIQAAFEKKKKQMRISDIRGNNMLWRKKYAKKWETVEKAWDKAFNKLWLKYHVSLSSTKVKDGYKLI